MGGGAPTYTTSQTIVVPVLKVRQPRFDAEDSLDLKVVCLAMTTDYSRPFVVRLNLEKVDGGKSDFSMTSPPAKERSKCGCE